MKVETFGYKQGGRIYTDKQENIAKIKQIIKEINEFEYDYLCDDTIAVFNGVFECRCVGKFEPDLIHIVDKCKQRHIVCGYIKGYESESRYGDDYITDSKSINTCIQQFYESGFWSKQKVLDYYGLYYLSE